SLFLLAVLQSFTWHGASGHWDFHGELPNWVPSFPDYDCRRGSATNGVLDWDAFRQEAKTGSPTTWRLQVGERLAAFDFAEAHELLADQRLPQCFLGTFFAAAVRYGECEDWLSLAKSPCSRAEQQLLSEVIQFLFRSVSVTVELLIGTEWPVLGALESLRLQPYYDDPELSCEDLEAPVLDWPSLQLAFAPGADWFAQGKPLVYNRGFQANWMQAMEECSYGFAMVSLWKLVVCAQTQAECVAQYSVMVEDLLRANDWREVVGNPWRMFGFLDSVRAGLKRHEFKLDFAPAELRGSLLPETPVPLLGPGSPVLAASVEVGNLTAAFAGVLDSVLAGIPKSYTATDSEGGLEVRKLLYITMVFGSQCSSSWNLETLQGWVCITSREFGDLAAQLSRNPTLQDPSCGHGRALGTVGSPEEEADFLRRCEACISDELRLEEASLTEPGERSASKGSNFGPPGESTTVAVVIRSASKGGCSNWLIDYKRNSRGELTGNIQTVTCVCLRCFFKFLLLLVLLLFLRV
ncbi:unnamed protein product, partial [Polarella glacialis]